LLAIHHPIRENRMLAIQMLGDLHYENAIPRFAEILQADEDFYIQREVLFALSKVPGTASSQLIEQAASNGSPLVRSVAERLVRGENVC